MPLLQQGMAGRVKLACPGPASPTPRSNLSLLFLGEPATLTDLDGAGLVSWTLSSPYWGSTQKWALIIPF